MPDLLLPDEGADERAKSRAAQELILPPLADPVASANAREAAVADPEKFAKAKRIAEQLALPVPTVERNLDSLDSERKVREMQARMVADPFYADRMRDPNFAKLSQGDDLSLSGVAKSIALLPWKGVQFTASGAPLLVGGLAGAFAATLESTAEGMKSAVSGVESVTGLKAKRHPEDIFARIGAKYRGLAGEAISYGKRVADLPPDAGFVQQAVFSGFQSLGQNLPPMLMAMYTGNAPAALVIMSAASGGQSYVKGKEVGLPTLAAARYGVYDAAWEYITEVLPFTKLLGEMKAGAPFIKAFMHNQVSEQLGEQVATVMQDFDEWVFLHPNKPFSA